MAVILKSVRTLHPEEIESLLQQKFLLEISPHVSIRVEENECGYRFIETFSREKHNPRYIVSKLISIYEATIDKVASYLCACCVYSGAEHVYIVVKKLLDIIMSNNELSLVIAIVNIMKRRLGTFEHVIDELEEAISKTIEYIIKHDFPENIVDDMVSVSVKLSYLKQIASELTEQIVITESNVETVLDHVITLLGGLKEVSILLEKIRKEVYNGVEA